MCTCRAVGHHSNGAELLSHCGVWVNQPTGSSGSGQTGKSLEAVPLSPGCPVVALVPQQFCWCR